VKTTITVLVERHAKEGKEEELIELLKHLRTVYISQSGYISSELLQSVEDKSIVLVLVTWLDATARKAYADNPKRLEIISKIEALLTEPSKYLFLKTTS